MPRKCEFYACLVRSDRPPRGVTRCPMTGAKKMGRGPGNGKMLRVVRMCHPANCCIMSTCIPWRIDIPKKSTKPNNKYTPNCKFSSLPFDTFWLIYDDVPHRCFTNSFFFFLKKKTFQSWFEVPVLLHSQPAEDVSWRSCHPRNWLVGKRAVGVPPGRRDSRWLPWRGRREIEFWITAIYIYIYMIDRLIYLLKFTTWMNGEKNGKRHLNRHHIITHAIYTYSG